MVVSVPLQATGRIHDVMEYMTPTTLHIRPKISPTLYLAKDHPMDIFLLKHVDDDTILFVLRNDGRELLRNWQIWICQQARIIKTPVFHASM